MNIYVYSDESGVFDYIHNKYFVFGGLIIIGDKQKEELEHRYAAIEKILRRKECYKNNREIKANTLSNSDKNNVFRALNNYYKFACVITERRVLKNIWDSKKDKQRYLDFAYKISVKRAFERMIRDKIIEPDTVERVLFYVDEHSTATNGRYELRESLEQEFKFGTYNINYSKYFPPIFKKMKDVNVDFCDSSAPNKKLIRAADIIANKIYYLTVTGKIEKNNIKNIDIEYLP